EPRLRVDGCMRFGLLEFDKQAVLDKHVGAKGVLDDDAAMFDGDRQLAFEIEPACLQFGAEQNFVGGFQEPGPEGPVKLKTAVHHNSSQFFKSIWIEISWLRGFVRAEIVHGT